MTETEAKDYMRGIDALAESEPREAECPAPVVPDMPNLNHFEDYPDVHWMLATEVYAYRDSMVAWADERVQKARDPLASMPDSPLSDLTSPNMPKRA